MYTNYYYSIFDENAERIINDIFGVSSQSYGLITTNEDGSSEVIKMDIPGVPKENVVIEVNDSTLYVTAKRDKNTTYTRKWKLNKIDSDNIKAKVENGELTITLHKIKDSKNKKITIE